VTFGATDAPLKGEELDKFGLVQFPMVMGGIVPVVNIEGIAPGGLVLDGKTLAAIFLGSVKTWDDPAIKKLNPNARLPSQPIAVVHRSDGSGTTFNFTYYLALVSPDWKSERMHGMIASERQAGNNNVRCLPLSPPQHHHQTARSCQRGRRPSYP
jgi:phosphate transport system substrate-binding protein